MDVIVVSRLWDGLGGITVVLLGRETSVELQMVQLKKNNVTQIQNLSVDFFLSEGVLRLVLEVTSSWHSRKRCFSFIEDRRN